MFQSAHIVVRIDREQAGLFEWHAHRMHTRTRDRVVAAEQHAARMIDQRAFDDVDTPKEIPFARRADQLHIAVIPRADRAEVEARVLVVETVAMQPFTNRMRREITAAGCDRAIQRNAEHGEQRRSIHRCAARQPLRSARPILIFVVQSWAFGSIGKSIPCVRAKSIAREYPASACRRTPMPGSLVRTRSRRRFELSLPSATTTMPACCE